MQKDFATKNKSEVSQKLGKTQAEIRHFLEGC